MPISLGEFRKLPSLPLDKNSKLVWEVYSLLMHHPASIADLTRLLNAPPEVIVSLINELVRIGFVAFHLPTGSQVLRFYWVQTVRSGKPALGKMSHYGGGVSTCHHLL
jgi:hypothetical protein